MKVGGWMIVRFFKYMQVPLKSYLPFLRLANQLFLGFEVTKSICPRPFSRNAHFFIRNDSNQRKSCLHDHTVQILNF